MVRNFVLHARLAFPDPVNRFIFIVDSVLQTFYWSLKSICTNLWRRKINITGLLNKLAFINRDWFNLSIWMATLCFDHWCIPHRRCHIDCMAVFGDHLLRFLNKSWKLPTLFSSVYTIHKGLIYFISCHFSDLLLLGRLMLSI